MKYKILAFFEGRNGLDSLAKTILWASLIVMLLSIFIPVDWLRSVIYGISWCGLIYAYYRVFSRKLAKRQAENYAFASWKNRLKQRWQQRKTHRFYHCPRCKTVLRVPKGKGKISITCRNCGEKFIRKT